MADICTGKSGRSAIQGAADLLRRAHGKSLMGAFSSIHGRFMVAGEHVSPLLEVLARTKIRHAEGRLQNQFTGARSELVYSL